MADHTLTSASRLTCPHGATVNVTPSEARVSVDGARPLHPTDAFTVAGCPFVIPAGPATVSSPCVTVVWAVPDLRSKCGGVPTLSASSTGLCFAATGLLQGEVQKLPAQTRVKTS